MWHEPDPAARTARLGVTQRGPWVRLGGRPEILFLFLSGQRELSLPASQIMALFNKVVRKMNQFYRDVVTAAIVVRNEACVVGRVGKDHPRG